MIQAEETAVAKGRSWGGGWGQGEGGGLKGWLDLPNGHRLCLLTHSFLLTPPQGFCIVVPSAWIILFFLFKGFFFFFFDLDQLNGYEFEQTPADSEGQGSLACCSPWGYSQARISNCEQ